MVKRFFKNLSQSFCIYLLAALNLIHAIQKQDYDWLLWVSLALALLSLALALIAAVKEDETDGQA